MATAIPTNSVWAAMSYHPPRGRCNFKPSLMSPACSCLRFMLHPVKAATSFECDGCQHHASFHSLENKEEDAILKKWEDKQRRPQLLSPQIHNVPQSQVVTGVTLKRKRIAEKSYEETEMPGDFEITIDPDDATYAAEEELRQELVGRKKQKGRKVGG